MKKISFSLVLLALGALVCRGQTTTSYDLGRLFADHKLTVFSGDTIKVLSEGKYHGVTCSGIVWINDVNFTTGTIDIDIRGRDVYQQSFLGIAFHGVDTTNYDAVYFRPFNFQSADALRKMHRVQYISAPDYPWERLREQHPLVYENTISPAPDPKKWLHAHIVVTKDEIAVYVNHAVTPSLKVKKLNNRTTGLIGLWDVYYTGDFANLVIRNEK